MCFDAPTHKNHSIRNRFCFGHENDSVLKKSQFDCVFPTPILCDLIPRLLSARKITFFIIVLPRISHDPARYPRYLPEAYCLCKGCLSGPNGEESERLRSTPVFMPTVILRRTGSCVGGRHSYTESYVSIAVGCTCVPLLEKDRRTQKAKPSVNRVSSKNSSTFRKNGLN